MTTLTAWEGLFDRLGVSRTGAEGGRAALIIGGAGGVGSIAIQLAKRVAHLRVIATASRPESGKWARDVGADEVIDQTKDLAAQLAALGRPEVEYILCCNSTDHHFPAFAKLIAPQGKICAIVSTQKPVDLAPLMQKSVTFAWELMFTRPTFQTSDVLVQHQILDAAATLIEAGTLTSTVTTRLQPINAANLKKAHALLEGGHVVGKIVLEGF